MKTQIYLMQDVVSGSFGSPFFASNDDEVRRDYKEVCNSGDVPERFLKDTVILCFGEFIADKVNPCFTMYDVPRVVVRGGDFSFEKDT